MRILFISEYYYPHIGGGEISLKTIVNELGKEHDVHVLTGAHESAPAYEHDGNITIHRRIPNEASVSGLRSNLRRLFVTPQRISREATELCREHEFDIIHLFGRSLLAAPRLSRLGIPLFHTINSYFALCPTGHLREPEGLLEPKPKLTTLIRTIYRAQEIGKTPNTWIYRYNPLAYAFLITTMNRSRRALSYCQLLAVGAFVQESLAHIGYESTIVYHPVEMSAYHAVEEHETDKPTILYLGAYTEFKGPQNVLKAAADTDARVVMHGSGPLKQELEELSETLDVDAEINDAIPHEETPEAYAKSDIVVVPTLHPEPSGRVAVEAMAAGKPVIGARSGGIPETIENADGLTYEPNDIEGLKDHIEHLIENPQEAKEMGERAREAVEKVYSPEESCKHIVEQYRTVTDLSSPH